MNVQTGKLSLTHASAARAAGAAGDSRPSIAGTQAPRRAPTFGWSVQGMLHGETGLHAPASAPVGWNCRPLGYGPPLDGCSTRSNRTETPCSRAKFDELAGRPKSDRRTRPS